jgi:ribose transport system permease protein
MSATTEESGTQSFAASVGRTVLTRSRGILALLIVVAIGIVFNADGTFFTAETHRAVLRQGAEFGILATGMTVVILTAGIDLSVGSVLGLTAMIFSLLLIPLGIPVWIAVPATLLAGAAVGATNGLLITQLKMQPFVATLAMMVFARGLAKYVYGGRKVSCAIRDAATGEWRYVPEPPIFNQIDANVFNENIAVVALIFLACVLVLWIVVGNTRFGRHLYAIGGNEEAAKLSGIRVAATKVFAYTICGLTGAVAGICRAAQDHQGDPEAGMTYELFAIAAVVIGGTSLMGGRGGLMLTLMGALIIAYIDKILSINAVGEPARLMVQGAIIVFAVAVQQRNR